MDFHFKRQAIYYPKNVLNLKKNELFEISCDHDEYSLWFDLNRKGLAKQNGNGNEHVQNDCQRSLGVTIVSRNRLGQLNDMERNQMFIDVLEKVIDSLTRILCI